jgi:hypothetical protein
MSSDTLNDIRWEPYRKHFQSIPVYYFNSLTYPESYEHSEMILRGLELDIKNIEAQFIEQETELRGLPASQREIQEREYEKWKTKALRAQKMKFNQIRILEAWTMNNQPEYEERIRILETNNLNLRVRVESLESEYQELRELLYAQLSDGLQSDENLAIQIQAVESTLTERLDELEVDYTALNTKVDTLINTPTEGTAP